MGRSAIQSFLAEKIPLDRLRQRHPSRLYGGHEWTGDDEADRWAAEYSTSAMYDAQSAGFMVDILPYFFDILRQDDARYRSDEVMRLLDVGARTGAGSNLLGQVFFGVWSRRPAVVDIVDVDPTFRDYVLATRRFVRDYLVRDVAKLPTASYDYVFASHVLEHVGELQPFARHLQRIARKRVICYTPYNELDPIPSHYTISDETLDSIGARDRHITDKSWFWKNPDKHLETVLFWLPGNDFDAELT